jgi:formyl-CoA transferase
MVVDKGDYRGTGTPVKLSRTPGGVRIVPPAFGEATRAVLAEAGYSPAEIEALIAAGIAIAEQRKAAE